MSQKLAVNDFKWLEDIFEFNEGFMKSYNDESNEGHFLDVALNILKICVTLTMIYSFCLKERKLKNWKSLMLI